MAVLTHRPASHFGQQRPAVGGGAAHAGPGMDGARLRTAAPAAGRPRAARAAQALEVGRVIRRARFEAGVVAVIGGTGEPRGATLQWNGRNEVAVALEGKGGQIQRGIVQTPTRPGPVPDCSAIPSPSNAPLACAAATTTSCARATSRPCRVPAPASLRSCRSRRATRVLPRHSMPGCASQARTSAAGLIHAAWSCQSRRRVAPFHRPAELPVAFAQQVARACCSVRRTPQRESRDSWLSSGEWCGASSPAGRPEAAGGRGVRCVEHGDPPAAPRQAGSHRSAGQSRADHDAMARRDSTHRATGLAAPRPANS